MIIKSFTINTSGGGKINRPGQLAPRLCNQAYETERQGILLSLTCIMTVIDATSYSDRKITKWHLIFFLLLLGGGQDKPAWTACPPGVKIIRVGGKISRDSLPPGGQANRGWLAPVGQADQGAR